MGERNYVIREYAFMQKRATDPPPTYGVELSGGLAGLGRGEGGGGADKGKGGNRLHHGVSLFDDGAKWVYWAAGGLFDGPARPRREGLH